MKIKKLAAASLALCVGTLSGMSALAAANVYTTTTYSYDVFAAGTADTKVTVDSKVVDAAGGQITYLVCGLDSEGAVDENKIYYIDQATAAEGVANFTFQAKQSDLYGTASNAVAAVARFGSDDSTDALSTIKFAFNPGANSFGNGTATATKITDNTYTLDDATKTALGVSDTYTVAFGTISGNAIEYGFRLTYNGQTYDLPAAQSVGTLDNGTGIYCVVVDGVANADLAAYAK